MMAVEHSSSAAPPRPVRLKPTVHRFTVHGIKVTLAMKRGVVIVGGREEAVNPRATRMLFGLFSRFGSCPEGVGSGRLAVDVWGGDEQRLPLPKTARLVGMLPRVAADANIALHPFGLAVEIYRHPGIAEWPAYRVVRINPEGGAR